MIAFSLSLLVSLTLPIHAPAVAGQVHVVAADGSGDYTQIQPAVDEAVNGDTILVKSGTYALFSIVNEALTVAADQGHVVQIDGSVQVRNLAAGRDAVLSGLRLTGATGSQTWSGVGLRLKSNVGAVRVQNCTLRGIYGKSGALVEQCDNVAFVDTTFLGHPGLSSSSSEVALYDCGLQGYSGGEACPCNVGADGCAASGFLFASGSEISGGPGGGNTPCCHHLDGCDGGDGLVLISGVAVLLDCALEGGAGSLFDCCSLSCGFDYGDSGHAQTILGGTITPVAGSSRVMIAPAVVREQTVVPVTFEGQAGETVHLMISTRTQWMFLPTWSGVLLVRPKHPHLMTTSLGTIPAGGTLVLPIPFDELGPGVQSRVLHHQPVFIAPNGTKRLGTPASVLILDQAF